MNGISVYADDPRNLQLRMSDGSYLSYRDLYRLSLAWIFLFNHLGQAPPGSVGNPRIEFQEQRDRRGRHALSAFIEFCDFLASRAWQRGSGRV